MTDPTGYSAQMVCAPNMTGETGGTTDCHPAESGSSGEVQCQNKTCTVVTQTLVVHGDACDHCITVSHLWSGAKSWVAAHPKTFKGAMIALQGLTILSAFLDDGASLGGLPEEEGLEASLEGAGEESSEEASEKAATEATGPEETAGGSPGAPKDRSLQGTQDQLEGVDKTRDAITKKGGYRISDAKSKQDFNRALKQIKSSDDLEDQ